MPPWERILAFHRDLLRESEWFEAYMIENRWFPCEDDFESDLRNENTYTINVKQELQHITDGIARRPTGKFFADDVYIWKKLREIDKRMGQMRFNLEFKSLTATVVT
jgi:hypothetical protein